MPKHIIMQSSGGYEVYVNLINSPAGRYLSRQPYVMNLIKEALASQKLKKPELTLELDMGRVIGNTEIIETTEKDTIYYARPVKRNVFSRYAKNRYPSPSRKLTIRLKQDPEGDYEVQDTWIGPNRPPFPGDKQETATSRSYWQTHALVQDAQAIQSKSITKMCPY